MKRNLNGNELVGGDIGQAATLVSLPVPANLKRESAVGSAADLNTWVYMDAAGVNTFTVPRDSAFLPHEVAIGVGFVVVQKGTGQTTIVAADGVTLLAAVGLALPAQYSAVSIVRCGFDEWLVLGGVAA
jgi:hypothetical protein